MSLRQTVNPVLLLFFIMCLCACTAQNFETQYEMNFHGKNPSVADDYETHTNNLVERSGLFDSKQEETDGIQHLPVTCKKHLVTKMENDEVMDIFYLKYLQHAMFWRLIWREKNTIHLLQGPHLLQT